MGEKMRDLFITNVGSHMWGMEHDKSDVDLFRCYQAPSESFLLGNRHDGGHQILKLDGKEYGYTDKLCDISSFEIGHVIKQLLKGNVNFLWGVMSPNIVDDSEELQRLRKIVEENVAKNCYDSINGLTISNTKKYFFDSGFIGCNVKDWLQFGFYKNSMTYKEDETISDSVDLKKLNVICRTLLFGIHVLRGDGFVFEKTNTKSLGELKELYERFLVDYDYCRLPKKPDEVPFNDYLLDLRMEDLK